jgi:hypothetical protein
MSYNRDFHWASGCFLLLVLSVVSTAQAQNKNELKIQLINGTVQKPVAEAEIRLMKADSQGMITTRTLRTDVAGECLLDDWETVKQTPHLLQSSYRGVDYTLSLQQLQNPELAVLTVYELTEQMEPLKVGLPHMMVRRDGPLLEINEVYQIENQSRPPYTMFTKEGSFRFHLPQGASLIKAACSSGGSLMPKTVEVHASRDGEGYRTAYALKPGSNLVQVVYRMNYSNEQVRLNLKYYYPLSLFHMMLAPGDIQVDSTFLKEAGSDAGRKMRLFAAGMVPANQELMVGLSGGSLRSPEVSDEDMPGQTTSPDTKSGEEEGENVRIVPLAPRIAGYQYLILGNLSVLLAAFLGWAYSNHKSTGIADQAVRQKSRAKVTPSKGSR